MMGDLPTPYLVGVDILVRDTRSEYYTQYLSPLSSLYLHLLKHNLLFYSITPIAVEIPLYGGLCGLRSMDTSACRPKRLLASINISSW